MSTIATKSANAPKSAKLSLDTVGYVIQFVPDVKKTLSFYRDTLGLKTRAVDDGWVEFETKGGLTYALHGCESAKGQMTEVVFSVGDVLATREALIAKGVKVEEPRVVCEHSGNVGLSVLFKDPAGNQLSAFGFVPKSRWNK